MYLFVFVFVFVCMCVHVCVFVPDVPCTDQELRARCRKRHLEKDEIPFSACLRHSAELGIFLPFLMCDSVQWEPG